jgi:ABC-2 type transport system ATP-binding protein
MIEINGLTKRYGDRCAIDHLSFKINKGEVVGFLGPNGAGKTTTMKILTGFMAPSSGEVRVAGFDVFESPLEVKRRIGYLPETPPVYGDMVVRDYLEFVARLKGVEKTNVKKSVDRAIEKTQLGDVSHRLIQNLSKGFRQRVGLAQAITSNPDILVLDEPTVGLDPRQVAEIRSLLLELRGSHTIILSTHILPEVQATCERVIIIDKGHIVAQDTLAGLSGRIGGGASVQVRVRRNSNELAAAVRDLKGVSGVDVSGQTLRVHGVQGEDSIEAIAELAVTKRTGLIGLSQPESGLEDIFIQLTSSKQ